MMSKAIIIDGSDKIMSTKNQTSRRQALQRFGEDLQDRLSTKYMDVQRMVPNAGFFYVLKNEKVNAAIVRDQPDLQTEPTAPVKEKLRVHMPKEQSALIRNTDTITIKVLNKAGTGWSDVWRGIAGNPATLDSRTRFNMQVQTLGAGDMDDVAPPPEE